MGQMSHAPWVGFNPRDIINYASARSVCMNGINLKQNVAEYFLQQPDYNKVYSFSSESV